MDILSIITQQQDDEEDEEENRLYLLTVAGLVCGILGNEMQSARRRNPSRLYLTRPQLMPNPRSESPWVRLWAGQEDRAFITTMGFDVRTFRFLLEGHGHFADVWESTAIPREDVSTNGVPRLVQRSLDAAGALGLVLHFLGSAILEVQLQQIFAVVPSVLNRYLNFSLDILRTVLRRMKAAQITLPRTPDEYQEYSDLITARHSLLEGAFASIDGLSLLAEVSNDPEIENATYNGWKTDHVITNVLVFSPKGTWFCCVYIHAFNILLYQVLSSMQF